MIIVYNILVTGIVCNYESKSVSFFLLSTVMYNMLKKFPYRWVPTMYIVCHVFLTKNGSFQIDIVLEYV